MTLAILLLSAGVPALYGGDELGRTQQGNNNPYCQDNKLTWTNWELDGQAKALMVTRQLIALRARHAVFRQRRSLRGREVSNSRIKDVTWFTARGTEMSGRGWKKPGAAFGMFLSGKPSYERKTFSEKIDDDSFLLLFNGGSDPAEFTLPGPPWADGYEQVIDTGDITATADHASGGREPGSKVIIGAWSMRVSGRQLRQENKPEVEPAGIRSKRGTGVDVPP